MEMFAFGAHIPSENRRGEPVDKGEFALHVQCAWRIVKSGEVLVGSRDIFLKSQTLQRPSSALRQADWTRSDERLLAFFDMYRADPVTVARVEADSVGGVRLGTIDGSVLEVFPDQSVGVEAPSEYWRFFQPGNAANHLVIGAHGVEA
jgi:hypothetical protein